MNIIKDGDGIRYLKKNYSGICNNCGCEFETAINIVQGNALTRFVPESGMEISKISGNILTISCPQCEYKHVLLAELKEG